MVRGAAAFYVAGAVAFPLVLPALLLALFAHDTLYAFLLNGFHEFCHRAVFKTKILNTIFLSVFSFLGWYNPVLFWAGHQERLHPFISFLYWRMNYHIEHHMYAAVPCYNLAKLHEAIKHDLPPCPVGLVAAWKEIGAILKRQEADPSYQYVPPLPSPSPAAGASH